jgi:hypothetical protein
MLQVTDSCPLSVRYLPPSLVQCTESCLPALVSQDHDNQITQQEFVTFVNELHAPRGAIPGATPAFAVHLMPEPEPETVPEPAPTKRAPRLSTGKGLTYRRLSSAKGASHRRVSTNRGVPLTGGKRSRRQSTSRGVSFGDNTVQNGDGEQFTEIELPLELISRKDASLRVGRKGPLKIGDLICLKGLNNDFVTTLQNPLFAASRICVLSPEEIVRPFALVAVFELCASAGKDDSVGTPVTFGMQVSLKHVGTQNKLMVNPDKPAEAAHNAVQAFLYSDKGLDDLPKNSEARLVFHPKLKTRHEGDTVASGEQCKLMFGGEGARYTLNIMNQTEKRPHREVNAILPDELIPDSDSTIRLELFRPATSPESAREQFQHETLGHTG